MQDTGLPRGCTIVTIPRVRVCLLTRATKDLHGAKGLELSASLKRHLCSDQRRVPGQQRTVKLGIWS